MTDVYGRQTRPHILTDMSIVFLNKKFSEVWRKRKKKEEKRAEIRALRVFETAQGIKMEVFV